MKQCVFNMNEIGNKILNIHIIKIVLYMFYHEKVKRV